MQMAQPSPLPKASSRKSNDDETQLDSVLADTLERETRTVQRPSHSGHQTLVMMVVYTLIGVGVAVGYFLYMRMRDKPSPNSGGITDCPRGVVCSKGPVVTLKNPFVLPGNDTPTVPAGLDVLVQLFFEKDMTNTPVTCANISGSRLPTTCDIAGAYSVEVTDPANWALGFDIKYKIGCKYSEAQSSGAGGVGNGKMDTSKTVMGLDPAICKDQLGGWEIWRLADLDNFNVLNGDVTVGRPKSSGPGWTTLGDFIYHKDDPAQPVMWASVPLFWTTQGTLSSNWQISCTTSGSLIIGRGEIVFSRIGGPPNSGKFCYVVPFSAGNASTKAPPGFPDTSAISPYTGALRNNLGFPAQGTPAFNMLTRLPRVGDIVANTSVLEVTASDMKLRDLLGAMHMSEVHMPYLQALNKNHAGSYLGATTNLDAFMPVGSHLLVAGLPVGYTDP